MPRYQKAQGQGVLSPSEIATLRRAKAESQRQKQILRDRGVLSPSEIVRAASGRPARRSFESRIQIFS